MSTASRNAIVLLSGGLDSATILAVARQQKLHCYALTFDYGQRHAQELQAARRVAAAQQVVEHRIISIDLKQFGGSALTADLPVPKRASVEDVAADIPVTYVPARNTIFLAYALAWSEVLPAENIFIGVNALDYSGYPDCRPEFLRAFQHLASVATRQGVLGQPIQIHAPLINCSKAEIIRQGWDLQVDYSLTTSCYDPSPEGLACGACDACLLRLKGFAENGLVDPIAYQNPTTGTG